jgi:hypothetical protein
MFTFKTQPAQGDRGRRESGLALEAGSARSQAGGSSGGAEHWPAER